MCSIKPLIFRIGTHIENLLRTLRPAFYRRGFPSFRQTMGKGRIECLIFAQITSQNSRKPLPKREKIAIIHTSGENLRRDRRAAFHRRGFQNVPIYASTRAALAGMLLHRRIPLAVLKRRNNERDVHRNVLHRRIPLAVLKQSIASSKDILPRLHRRIPLAVLKPDIDRKIRDEKGCTGEYRLRY